jgi:RHS repeat-associated protein
MFTRISESISGRKPTRITDRAHYKYTAREWYGDTTLQYNRARYYDPKIGRWISQDPSGFVANDQNVYRYVRNQQLMALDPDGLEAITLHGSDNRRIIFDSLNAQREYINNYKLNLSGSVSTATYAGDLRDGIAIWYEGTHSVQVRFIQFYWIVAETFTKLSKAPKQDQLEMV